MTSLRLRSLIRWARVRISHAYHHPDLGPLTFRTGIWKGEITHGDSPVRLSLESGEREPDAEILQVALEAVRGLDRFIPVALGFLALQPAYTGMAGSLAPIGISVTRPDPTLTLARIRPEGMLPLRYAPHGQPIWGLQFHVPGEKDVLEVFFFRGIPIFADYHPVKWSMQRRGTGPAV
jgi:hypothetical protein